MIATWFNIIAVINLLLLFNMLHSIVVTYIISFYLSDPQYYTAYLTAAWFNIIIVSNINIDYLI